MGYFLVFSTIQGNFVALEFLSKIRPRRRCNFYTFFPLLLIITVYFFEFLCAPSKKDILEIHLPNDGQPMTIINVKIWAIKPRKKIYFSVWRLSSNEMAPFGARDQISAVLAFMNEWELRGYNTTEYVVNIMK